MTNGIFTFFCLYALVIVVSEFMYKRGVSLHTTRKFAHIGAGVVSALLPFFVSLSMAIVIGAVSFIFSCYFKKKKILPSIYAGRDDHGVAYFSLGLVVCALLFWDPNPAVFSLAVLLFALADGLAGFVGQNFGKTEYDFTGKKTVEGSIVFFIVSSGILRLQLLRCWFLKCLLHHSGRTHILGSWGICTRM